MQVPRWRSIHGDGPECSDAPADLHDSTRALFSEDAGCIDAVAGVAPSP